MREPPEHPQTDKIGNNACATLATVYVDTRVCEHQMHHFGRTKEPFLRNFTYFNRSVDIRYIVSEVCDFFAAP
jgi:hypothetical protein